MEILHGIKIFEIFNENKIKKKVQKYPTILIQLIL